MRVCRNQVFFILANNSDFKENKKYPTEPFVDIGMDKSVVVGACQSFQFFRQKIWFLESTRALSKFLHEILHYLISITKL